MDQGLVFNHLAQEVIAICPEKYCQHNYCVNCERKPHLHNKIYKLTKETFDGLFKNISSQLTEIEYYIEEIKQFFDVYLHNVKNTLSIVNQILLPVGILKQIKLIVEDLELNREQVDAMKDYCVKIKKGHIHDVSTIPNYSQEISDEELDSDSYQNQGTQQSSHNFGLYNNFSNNLNTSGADQQVSVDLKIDRQQTQIQ